MITSVATVVNDEIFMAPITLEEQLRYTMAIYGHLIHSKRLYICKDKMKALIEKGIKGLRIITLKNRTFKLVWEQAE